MTKHRYASDAAVEFAPTYSSTEVQRILHASGIRACRERVTRMADDLFGWPADGRHRRITADEMTTLLEVFTLVDQVGMARSLVVSRYVKGIDVLDDLHDGLKRSEKALTAARSTVRAGSELIRNSSDPAERREAARSLRDAAATLERVRAALVAA